MSNINIRRAVENIRTNTTVYTPIIEVIVNAIQAIESLGRADGEVSVRVYRSDQLELGSNLPDIRSIEVEDNGIGFTDENRDAFDTLYTDSKIAEGGKGFGRFTCLKYFDNVKVKSVFLDRGVLKERQFSMGKDRDIIVDERIRVSPATQTGTVVRMEGLKKDGLLEKRLDTIARNIAEKILPYLIADDYASPIIKLSEHDGTDVVRLNDYVTNNLSSVIREISARRDFCLQGSDGPETFLVRIFRIYYPKNQKSRVSLVAHKREVSGSPLQKYVPEFSDDFYDLGETEDDRSRNYILKAYVFGSYLDRHVALERGGFDFQADQDLFFGISQTDIESAAAEIAREAAGEEVTLRQDRKRERILDYVDKRAPWHKDLVANLDMATIPFNPSDEEIEERLQSAKFTRERQVQREVAALLDEETDFKPDTVQTVVSKLSETSKNDLAHYIALRRYILDIFEKSLHRDATGSYSHEGIVHDIIFPRREDTNTLPFDDHNLWLIDERLNFTRFISSDAPLSGGFSDRPDLLIFNHSVVFRGDNEASNPITIFEFKRPRRDDFANPSASAKEDPIQQIIRSVNDIRDGRYTTPEGRRILVSTNTPFYGYVICDLTTKVETWLLREKNCKPMPDGLGWFLWQDNINLYLEVLSWDKVLRDAKMRNLIFFHKLGI